MTHISDIGWFPDRVEQLPAGSRLALVVRVEVGDWVAVQSERVVAVLPTRTALTRTVAGRSSAAQCWWPPWSTAGGEPFPGRYATIRTACDELRR